MIENKHKEVFLNLEKDYLEVYLKEFGMESKGNFIPNMHSLSCLMHKFKTRMNEKTIQNYLQISNDYKEFHISLKEVLNNKLPYFKVNPLYLFLKTGFLELFQPKKWNIKMKLDFTNLESLEPDQKFTVLQETLIEKFEKAFEY